MNIDEKINEIEKMFDALELYEEELHSEVSDLLYDLKDEINNILPKDKPPTNVLEVPNQGIPSNKDVVRLATNAKKLVDHLKIENSRNNDNKEKTAIIHTYVAIEQTTYRYICDNARFKHQADEDILRPLALQKAVDGINAAAENNELGLLNPKELYGWEFIIAWTWPIIVEKYNFPL